jgi:hypothetical protein
VSPPLPPSDIAGRNPRLVTIAAGAILHRFYTKAFDPIFHDRSLDGRLNAPDGSYGVLYTAERSGGAFAESFLRTPGRRTLDPGLQARKAHVTLEVVRPMTLIAFDGPGLAILGATAEVVHGGLPYDCPQAWSAALHAHPAGVDGIAYSARHDPHETCYALFDRASAAIREKRRILDLDADWFWKLANAYEVGRAP